jgi:hypothetical protein
MHTLPIKPPKISIFLKSLVYSHIIAIVLLLHNIFIMLYIDKGVGVAYTYYIRFIAGLAMRTLANI